MKAAQSQVEVHLVPTAPAVYPDRPLGLRLQVRNHTADELREAVAEVTAEVERGVLLTWDVALAAVPAGATSDDAVRASSPEWSLPRNVPAGLGRWRVTVRGAGGELLAADELELPVAAA